MLIYLDNNNNQLRVVYYKQLTGEEFTAGRVPHERRSKVLTKNHKFL